MNANQNYSHFHNLWELQKQYIRFVKNDSLKSHKEVYLVNLYQLRCLEENF